MKYTEKAAKIREFLGHGENGIVVKIANNGQVLRIARAPGFICRTRTTVRAALSNLALHECLGAGCGERV